ncbi:BgTH12-07475 [Blumeria graminis f. sp. triticale]|uniref:BgTH12-07475 n=1 Tax=Blumeria graminis f. sp. triticale TaxID=1689686 RepID=A0A9W4D2W0_BLUGR|nr:BgTH12-07475 [Blumeria graminis f. sp. triticale]
MLLIRNPLLKSDRIVFTSIDNRWSTDSKTYDEVYTASTGGFPKPEDDSGIFMAIDDSHTLGTHYAIYCSKTMPFTEMMSKIIVGGSPMTGQEILNLDRNSLADQTCYHHLQSLAPSIGAEKTSTPDTTIAVVWYQGRVHILEQCGEHKAAWFFNTINFENNNLRSLFTILKSFHQRNGRKGRLVKKSELGKRLNEKQMKKIDSSRTRNLQYQRIAFVDRPRHTQKVLGNLVDKTLCDSYKSRPPFYIQVLDTIFPPRQPPHRSLISTRNS